MLYVIIVNVSNVYNNNLLFALYKHLLAKVCYRRLDFINHGSNCS